MSDGGAFGSALLGGASADFASHAITIDSMQKKWRDSFTGPLADRWTVTTSGGVTATNSGGVLTIASGTTAAGFAELLSTEVFSVPMRLMIGVQSGATRQANTHHIVEFVSVNPVTHVPDGRHSVAWNIGGAASTTVTQGIYEVQNGGLAPLASAASTIVTTATYSVLELEPFADESYFHSRSLDSTTGRANSYVRHQQIPDPNALYKVRIRSLNHAAWRTISGAVAGTGGVIRLTSTAHGYTGTPTVWVEALNGVTNGGAEVRGNYPITVVDVNTIELTGTVFGGTYVAGSGRVALGAAPAASISLQAQFVNVQDYAELTAEITAGRGQLVQGQAIGVQVTNSPTIAALPASTAAIGDVGVQYRANATGAASRYHFVSAATTNAANIKATAGRLVGYTLSNTTAAWRFVKLHNSATAPTAGAGVVQTIGIPPNATVALALEGGVGFSAGIGITCVTGAADADATATAVADVVGDLFFA